MNHSEKKTPFISVVIPVKNEAKTVESCIESILKQTVSNSLEIITIDSGSTDGTLEILKKFNVKLIQIKPEEFNHGETRNVGIRAASGEFVVCTVMDAVACDEKWIENMLRHFDDPKVAGVCGKQVVPHHEDKNPLEWFRPVNQPSIKRKYFENPTIFNNLSNYEKWRNCGWDDVTTMYRREVMLKMPFQKVSFAEDMIWAKDALANGYTIVFDDFAKVYHYHHYNFAVNFKRVYAVVYHIYKTFNLVRPIDSIFINIPRIVYRIFKLKLSFGKKIKWLIYNLKIAISAWFSIEILRANVFFRGEKGADNSYQYFCKKPPQPIKKR